jgi:ParB family transcriptional regulator, chromosome partitioning protein
VALLAHAFATEIGRLGMTAPSRGMGRGLAEILRVSGTPAPTGDDLRNVPVELIAPNPRQPRRSFDQDALLALASSLRERGVL